MKYPITILTGSSSTSLLTTHHHNPHHSLSKPKTSVPIFYPFSSSSIPPTKLPPSSPPPPFTYSSLSPKPVLLPAALQLDPVVDINDRDPGTNLRYYAEVASMLVEEGRFKEFGLIVESVLESDDIGASRFGRSLNLELVAAGISDGLKNDRIREVFQLLSNIRKLGVNVNGLFNDFATQRITEEVRAMVKNDNVEEAVELMEILRGFRFSIRNIVNPNDMIHTCIEKGNPSVAVRYACLLPHVDILLCTIIKEFAKKGDLASALTVFEASKQKLDGHNMFIYRSVIDACGLCGNSFKSRSIYEDLLAQEVIPNIYVFNSVMNVNTNDLSYTMQIYKQMQGLGVVADMTTYNILLKACCRAGRVDLAQNIYSEVKSLEAIGAIKLDLFTYSTIIKAFADANLRQMAMSIKEDMVSAGVTPNTVTWSSLISACANAGYVDEATRLFEEMLLTGCEPNSQCFNIILHACVEAHQYDRAFRLFHAWKTRVSQEDVGTDGSVMPIPIINTEPQKIATSVPFQPTTATYNIMIKACGSDYHRAKALMDEMKSLRLSPNQITWSSMINICGNSGNVEGALKILKAMHESGSKPDVIVYTSAIKACVKNKNLTNAFALFTQMRRYGVKPNLVTFNTLLRARDKYGSLEEVQQCLAVYQDMRKAGYKPNDYYLKQLIEEWCEEVIQNNIVGKVEQFITHKRTDIGPRSAHNLVLERVAIHLQKGTAERLVVDIQGLTKTEARIVALAVLRMIKENHFSGKPVKDDLVIILGFGETGAVSALKDAISQLLKNELGLEVVTGKSSSSKLDRKLDSQNTKDPYTDSRYLIGGVTTRRPAVMQRLLVTGKSIQQWLRKSPKPGH